jgi:hypothetical protein
MSDDSVPAFDVGAFITGMLNLKISAYLTTIALVTWAWDILITMDDEVSLVWSRKGTLVKSLFLIVGFLSHFLLQISLIFYRIDTFLYFRCV